MTLDGVRRRVSLGAKLYPLENGAAEILGVRGGRVSGPNLRTLLHTGVVVWYDAGFWARPLPT